MWSVDAVNMVMHKVDEPFRFQNLVFKSVTYQCQKHGGVTVQMLQGKMPYMCPICEAQYMSGGAVKRLGADDYRQRNIPEEYWGLSLADFVCDTPQQKKALEAIKALIARKKGKVILRGSTGLGKTFLGVQAVAALGGLCYSQYEIEAAIRQSYRAKSTVSEMDILEKLCSAKCLFIDELGRGKITQGSLSWLFYVIDKRHTRGLPLVIATNTHTKKECTENGCPYCFENLLGGEATLSRFLQDTQIITLQGQDYRRQHTTYKAGSNRGVNNELFR